MWKGLSKDMVCCT